MGKNKELKCLNKISSLATHVPDLVVYATLTKEIPYEEHLNGVLLFADVSGFTALTQRFTLRCKKGYGADELTRTLNSYIGDITSHILAAGGDILNYAGDAILALWTVEGMQLRDAISLVVKCSLNIQNHCGVRETAVGCQLKVKIGISAGKLCKVIMGDNDKQYFVVIGNAVDEVRLAEGLAVASTIILSPNAWELCDRDNILIDPIENERAVKVRFFKREPSLTAEKYLSELRKDVEYEPLPKGCIRRASRLMPNEEQEKFLRKYIMNTVLQKIDDNQPLEYLSEMRPATVVFVNLQFKGPDADMMQSIDINKACLDISQQVHRHYGRVNKVFMFDKGCTFLCLFGLPGDKREDEGAHALQAACRLHELCLTGIKGLRTVSVGVTTGPVFCGVVGHAVRHEYTVIGHKVNLAARLMMYYPGVVSCDSETYQYSKLPASYFSELPKKPMKGVHNPGTLYQYLGKKNQINVGKAPLSMERQEEYPLLGREQEMDFFSTALKEYLEARSRNDKTYPNFVIYEGGTGFGKSHLLAEIVYQTAKQGVRVIPFELARTGTKQSNYTLQTVLAMLLAVSSCKSYTEREEIILSKIHDPELRQNLCLLNDIMLVKFPVSNAVSLMDSQTKSRATNEYFLELFCKMAGEEPSVFVMDQAHFVDQSSWAFLLEACERVSVLVCMALLPTRSQNVPFPELTRIINSHRTLLLQLPSLEPQHIAQLACQVLGVIRIPSEVELFLVERSQGVPYYCVELLKGLYLNEMIVLVAMEEEEADKDIDVLFLEPSAMLHHCKIWQDESRSSTIDQAKAPELKTQRVQAESSATPYTFVCLVAEGAKLNEISIPLTLKGMALAQLDQLQPAGQMLVKCAAILGKTFTTQMLRHVMPDVTEHKLNLSLVSLFQSATLECASTPKHPTQQLTKGVQRYGPLSCYCTKKDGKLFQKEVPGLASVDGVWQCPMVRFCMPLVRETAYELWLKEQKQEIHMRCASYLLKQATCCHHCGIGEFIYGHKAASGYTITHLHDGDPQRLASGSLPAQSLQGQCSGSVKVNQVMPVTHKEWENFLAKLESVLDKKRLSTEAMSSPSCRCAQVVECVLCPMMCHWIGIGDVHKAFYYLLETAAASVYLSSNLKALYYLNEAQIIMDLVNAGKPAFEAADPKVKVKLCKFEKACVFRLKGEVLIKMGQIVEAEEMFVQALMLLNRRFPRNKIAVSMKYISENLRRLHYRCRHLEIPGEKKLAFLQEQIFCLSYMGQINCMRSMPMRAALAIAMETNSATGSANKFKVVFSLTDCVQYSQHAGQEAQQGHYEQQLRATFPELTVCPEGMALLSHFLRTLVLVRLCSGLLHQAIEYGSCLRKLSKLINQPCLDMWAMSVLHCPLLFTGRYRECVHLMLTLECLGNVKHMSMAKGWFCVACLNTVLYAGFAVHQIKECLSFIERTQSNPNLMAEQSLMLNLYAALALWYSRLGEWEKARFFYTRACAVASQAPASIHSIGGVVMFLECNVLLFKKAVVEQNKHVKAIYKKTLKLFSDFSRRYSSNQHFLPRVCHLKAYMYTLAGNDRLAKRTLDLAIREAEKQENILELSWMQQSKDVWSGRSKQSHKDWFAVARSIPRWDEAAEMEQTELLRHRYPLVGLSTELHPEASSAALPPRENDPHIPTGTQPI